MSVTPNSDPEKKIEVFDEDDAVLAQLGYTQGKPLNYYLVILANDHVELKRSFGLIGMVGFSFSIVTSWTALSGVLIIGVETGGPPVMIWGWLATCVFTLAVAYSMAEMCSA
jgi:choline transport protein